MSYFIPVCLYPHTKYRTRAGVIYLLQKFELRSSDYLIVVADELLFLDRLVTGRFWTIEWARKKTRQEAEQILKMLKHTVSKAGAAERGDIVYWDTVAQTPQFREFSSDLRQRVMGDPFIANGISKFVERRVKRFGTVSDPERAHLNEHEYLLSELCMSVYCTEILPFTTEVWERPPAPDVPDVLKLLYHNKPELITALTGHSPRRTLKFLYDDIQSEISKTSPISASDSDGSP